MSIATLQNYQKRHILQIFRPIFYPFRQFAKKWMKNYDLNGKLQFSGDFTASNFCLISLCVLPSLVRVYSVASDLLASFASKTSLFRGTARGDPATQGRNFAERNMWIE